MVLIPKQVKKPPNTKFNLKSSGCKNFPNANDNSKLPSGLLGKGWEFIKNMVISAYDQRKLPFHSKLKNFFSITNIFTIAKAIFSAYREGKSFKEAVKDVLYQCAKIFAGITFCHITTSMMEEVVDYLLKSSVKGVIIYICGIIGCPPAPLLLFLFDILISYLGGKLVDLIIYIYNRFLKKYVEKAFDWVKKKAKSAWNWFTGLFK